MGYDRGDSFPLDSKHKWNSIWFRKPKGKLLPRSHPVRFERKWKYSFLSPGGGVLAGRQEPKLRPTPARRRGWGTGHQGGGHSGGGEAFRDFIKPPYITALYCIGGFKGALHFSPLLLCRDTTVCRTVNASFSS